MNCKPIHRAAALLGALLALASCNPAAPVFYTLEIERPPAADRGFPDEAFVHRMLKIGSRYFVAANKLYARLDGDDDTWTELDFPDFPGAPTNPKCNVLEEFGGEIYAGFFDDTTGDGLGLYRTPPDPISWTPIADFGGSVPSQVALLKTAGSLLFVAIGTDDGTGSFDYTLTYSGTGNSGDYLDWGVTLSNPGQLIRDVVSDGTRYWVIVGDSFYAENDVTPGVQTFASLSPPSSEDSYYGGLLFNVGTLFLSAGNGLLMSSVDFGGTWTSSETVLDDNEEPIPFAQFVLPTDDDPGTVYVGTRGYGYFRIPDGDVTPTVPWYTDLRFPTVSYSDLYNGVITAMFFDSSNNTLFLGTANKGLWRRGTQLSDGTWTWDQE